MAFSIGLGATGEYVLPAGIRHFPAGLAFGRDGRLFLGSGIGPNGEGDDTIVAFAPTGPIQASRLVTDPTSPLNLPSLLMATLWFPASVHSACLTP